MKQLLTIALLVGALARPAGATTLVATDLGGLARDARTIARGQIVAVDARWTDDRRSIETIVTLTAESYLKGRLGDTVQFRIPGGRLGRYRRVVVGAPEFRVGQQVIVFLGTEGPMVPFLVGLSQGVYRVSRDQSGDLLVTPPPAMPGAIGPLTRGTVARRLAPLAEFEASVRRLVEAAR
jgi:hypothetical protein